MRRFFMRTLFSLVRRNFRIASCVVLKPWPCETPGAAYISAITRLVQSVASLHEHIFQAVGLIDSYKTT